MAVAVESILTVGSPLPWGGLDKLRVYETLGVDEVWFWRKGVIEVYVYSKGSFVREPRSRVLPELDLEILASVLDRPSVTKAVRDFRAALQQR
jgi:hypothetical protein